MTTAELTRTGVGIHHVLIATDFSHQSDSALKYGFDLAHRFGAEAQIVYVLPTEEYVMAGPDGMLAAREAARRDLLELKASLRRSHAVEVENEYHVSMLEGPVAECLLQCAREKKTDLIVVGTHGRGGVGKIILGSVAEKVFRQSSVPVLTVGPNIHRPCRIGDLRHVLTPCDLTPKSHPAVQFACFLAAEHHAHLTILHVIERTDKSTKIDPEHVKEAVSKNLVEIVGKHAKGLDVDYMVEFGRIATTIAEVASGSETDLIVLGVRPSAGLFDRLQWPIAYKLVCEASCPVLTLRGGSPRV